MQWQAFPRRASLKMLALTLAFAAAGVVSSSTKSDSTGSAASGTESPVRTNEAALSVTVDSNLVQIPVTVTDKKDQVVEDLSKESFSVYENGVAQTIVHFGFEEAPISVCLVFDSSLSMANKLEKAIEAANEVLGASKPEDEYCLVRFSDWPSVLVGLTKNPAHVTAAVSRIYPEGFTALLDGIYTGMAEVKHAQNRHKAIVLISDGGDNRSRHTQHQIKNLVREADVQIYAIGVLSPEGQIFSQEEIDGPALMRGLSKESGGRLYRIHNLSDLPVAAAKINMALRHQYLLGYYPKQIHNDGKYRHIAVKLSPPKGVSGLRAYWRSGYYAPKD